MPTIKIADFNSAPTKGQPHENEIDTGHPGCFACYRLDRLGLLEVEVREASSRFLPSLLIALRAPFVLRRLAGDLTLEMAQAVQALAVDSPVIDAHRDRLLASARTYMTRRLRVFAKFSQLSACERLFSFWHVVHFPLFVVMAVAAVIHVIAVHVY